MLTDQYTVPLACVADWNVPEIESAEKELPLWRRTCTPSWWIR